MTVGTRLDREPCSGFSGDTFSCMTKIHEKSPCCRGDVRRFGGRRRQCCACGKTWRVWKARRGRKKLRISFELAHRFVLHRVLPTRAPYAGHRLSRNQRQYRLILSRHRCVTACPWPHPPDGALIVIADALVKYVGGRWQTWYFMLVRTRTDTVATVLPPYHRSGTETVAGWRDAFDSLDPALRDRIEALVCDGHRGLVYEAKWRGWLLQRCHFHLIARIQSRRSKWRTSRHPEEGKRIFALVKRVLTERTESDIASCITELEAVSWRTPSRDLAHTLKGFVNHFQEFRTYLQHPDLKLPTTNNTAEALIGLVEEASRRARGFRTAAAFHEWVVCVCTTRKTLCCMPGRKDINHFYQS